MDQKYTNDYQFGKKYLRNEQYSRYECVEIVGIPDSTDEKKVCKLIEKVTGKCKSRRPIIVSPAIRKQKNKIIVKFSRRKDVENVLRNKNKNKNFNPRSVDSSFKTRHNFFQRLLSSCSNI